LCAVAILGTARSFAQGTTTLVSRSSTGAQTDADSHAPIDISGDGRYVGFYSGADNLLANDTNGVDDVFVHDRATGQTTRVSLTSSGLQANGGSWISAMSPDARFVVFASEATNLVAGDTNGVLDVYLRDRLLNTTELVSTSSAGQLGDCDSGWASITPDGRFVAFLSCATNLVAGDTNGVSDVFLRDRSTGATTRVSVSSSGTESNGETFDALLSDDGRYVLYTSVASNLVPGDTNDGWDVFVRDVQLGTTSMVSQSSSGIPGNLESFSGALSGDGRYATFASNADNLVDLDTNQREDLFLRDLVLGTTTRISWGVGGTEVNGDTYGGALSADGRIVLMESLANNLVTGDTNGVWDVFARDLVTGTTTRVSQSSNGMVANALSDHGAISADGRYAVFRSWASNLVPNDTNGFVDIFVHDRLGCSPTIATYCTAASTSHGCIPSIAGIGVPSATTGSGFTIQTSAVEGQSFGICFYGISGPSALPFGGGASVLCVESSLQRTPVMSSGGTAGACDGQFALDWNQFIVTHPIAVGVPFVGGETVWAQTWFRDALAPGGSNLSNALWFNVCP
jgi:Tol biopolymer transport system component